MIYQWAISVGVSVGYIEMVFWWVIVEVLGDSVGWEVVNGLDNMIFLKWRKCEGFLCSFVKISDKFSEPGICMIDTVLFWMDSLTAFSLICRYVVSNVDCASVWLICGWRSVAQRVFVNCKLFAIQHLFEDHVNAHYWISMELVNV